MEPVVSEEIREAATVVDLDKDSTRFGEKATVIAVTDGVYVVEYEDGKQQTIATAAPEKTWDSLTAGDFLVKQGLRYRVIERLTNTVLLSNPGSMEDVGQWALIESLKQTFEIER